MALLSKKQQQNRPRRRIVQGDKSQPASSDAASEDRYTFRRNRTLTGSSSSNVQSSNESSAQLKSDRVHAHDLVKKRRSVGALLLMVATCALGLYLLIIQFTAGVVVGSSDASMKLDTSYEKAVQQYLAQHPIERLRFLLNTKDLNNFVQAANPEISSIKSDGPAGFGSSRFLATMRTPIAGWSVNNRQQYVDANGVSFARNYYPAPAVQIVDQSGIPATNGQAVASNRFLGFVGLVVGLSKTNGYAVTSVIIPEHTTRQIELRIKDIAYPVKFSVDRKAGEQVEDMARSLKWLVARGVTPAYLDVRISGKAFYK